MPAGCGLGARRDRRRRVASCSTGNGGASTPSSTGEARRASTEPERAACRRCGAIR